MSNQIVGGGRQCKQSCEYMSIGWLAGFQALPWLRTPSQTVVAGSPNVKSPIQTPEYQFNLTGMWQPQGDADKTLESWKKHCSSA